MLFRNSIINSIKTFYQDSIARNVLHGAEFSFGSLKMPSGYEKRRNNTRKSRKETAYRCWPIPYQFSCQSKKTVIGFKSVLLETY